jgi:hypothetical protein
MKIVNKTLYRTDHLKAILQKAAEVELEPEKRKVLTVTVSYTRGGASSGCAYVGGRHAWIRIRHPESRSRLAPVETTELVLSFASVASHEFAHIRGMNHQEMPGYYKWHRASWRDYVAWAATYPLDVKPARVAVTPTVSAKLAHVLKMKALAETRVKRATTILRKWKAKERYYQKAAQKVTP